MDRLREILADKLDMIETSHDYDNPNWAYRQAHDNGKREAIQEILNLIRKVD